MCYEYVLSLFILGALLSHFVEPIYFASIILGSLYHRDHMSRAVYTRIINLGVLPAGYYLNRPLLSGTTNPETRQPGKAPNFSINWIASEPTMEIVTAMHGKTESNNPSRVCKREMFQLFNDLYGKLPAKVLHEEPTRPRLYNEAKEQTIQYQTAKNIAHKAFEKASLGQWMKKPMEQDMFEL